MLVDCLVDYSALDDAVLPCPGLGWCYGLRMEGSLAAVSDASSFLGERPFGERSVGLGRPIHQSTDRTINAPTTTDPDRWIRPDQLESIATGRPGPRVWFAAAASASLILRTLPRFLFFSNRRHGVRHTLLGFDMV